MPNQSRNFQNHLTIIIGPPDQKAIDQNIGNWTNDANDSIDNLWIEHVSSYVDLLTQHKAPEYISEFERIFTHVLNEPIRIENLSVGKSYRESLVVPTIIINENDITDLNATPFPMKWICEEMRFQIEHYVHLLLKSQWVHTSISVAI